MDAEIIRTVLLAVFFCFLVLSSLLLLGTFLRAKVKVFQSLYLPASVIGGIIGLVIGPIFLRGILKLPIFQDWLSIFSLLPGILIVPVIASIPLGIRLRSKDTAKKGSGSSTRFSILIMFALLSIVGASQNLIGLLTAGIFKLYSNHTDMYPTFGTELAAGFSGGHGTAGVIANMLRSLEQPYWNTAQGVATTTATVGLIGGITIGILLINIAARSGKTYFIQPKKASSTHQMSGLVRDAAKQDIAGMETTNPSSIDSLTYHFAIILSVSGLAFLTVYLLKKANVVLLSYVPEWGYAILIMYLVCGVMQKANIDWTIDEKTTAKIRSALTEYAITAAIVSLPLQAVYVYFYPLLVMMSIGMAFTIFLILFLSKRMFKQLWFEKSMVIFGTGTGVFLTGLILLRMIDPSMQSSVLRDYSISFSIYSLTSFILFPISFGLLVQYGLTSGVIFFMIILLLYTIFLYIVKKMEAKQLLQ